MGRAPHTDLLLHAVAAAARFPIVPLRPGGKTPALNGWPHHATQDRDTIRRWWKACRTYNIGVCTGGELLVVDLDVADHGHGNEAGETGTGGVTELQRLAHEHGDEELWDRRGRPRTYTVRTPSSGLHLYFRTADPACCRNTQQHLGSRIDTRGRGGVVVGAGSIGAGGRRYQTVVHRPVAAAPAWLETALRPPPQPPTTPARVELPGADAAHRYVRRAVEDECAVVAAATSGGRNAALLRAARILGEFVGAGILREQDAVAALLAASAGHVGVEQFTEREATLTINSGIGYGRQHPRDLRTVLGPRRARADGQPRGG